MACKNWNDEWVAYLYDEIDPQETQTIETHLKGCSDCRETMDQLADSRRLLQLSNLPVPATPRVVVLQPRQRMRPAWAFAAGLAAAAAIFALGFLAGPVWLDEGTERIPDGGQNVEFTLSELDDMVPREEFQRALLETRNEFDRKLAKVTPATPPDTLQFTDKLVTREVFDDGISGLKRQMDAGRERDYLLILQQLATTEARTRNRIDSNRRALQTVTYASNPAIVER